MDCLIFSGSLIKIGLYGILVDLCLDTVHFVSVEKTFLDALLILHGNINSTTSIRQYSTDSCLDEAVRITIIVFYNERIPVACLNLPINGEA